MEQDGERDRRLARWHEELDRLIDLPQDEREAALACIADDTLRARLSAMLAPAASPLDRPLEEVAAALMRELSANAAYSPLPDGANIGPWRIERMLGEGGMARVYLAQRQQGPAQRVALKLLRRELVSPQLLARFAAEQGILARLEHPGIARFIDAGVSADHEPYLATEYVAGVSLLRWCRQRGLNVRERIGLFGQVLDAVQFAHRNLVVHRDLKPANVLVNADGQPKLLDFGIARLVDPQEAPGDAQTGTLLLTPEYAAPEQFRGERATTATDIYALGVVLYELLTGVRPRRTNGDGESGELLWPSRVATASPERPRGLGAQGRELRGDLDAIVVKALAAAPADRYPSVHALAQDLARSQRGEAISLLESRRGYRWRRALRRNWLVATLGSVAMLGSIATAWVALRSAHQAEQSRAQIERELRRANELQDLMQALFRAADPVRPATDLPTTAELLDAAAERVLAPGLGAEVRADTLAALTRIEIARQRFGPARRLADAALRLVREDAGIGDEAAARVLSAAAAVALSPENSDLDAGALLDAAEQHARSVDAAGYTLWRVGIERAQVAFQQNRLADVLALAEKLRAELVRQPLATEEDRFRLFGMLSVAYTRLQQYPQAQAAFDAQLALPMLSGARPDRRRAIVLVNSRGTELALAHFDEAAGRVREAISIYDAIFSTPREERAAARVGLGEVLLARGDIDAALLAFDRGNAERAQVHGAADAQAYAYTHFNRGLAMLQAERWPDAEAALEQALRLLGPVLVERKSNALQLAWGLARAHCALGRLDGIDGELAQAATLAGELGDNARFQQADLHESVAVCAQARGDSSTALVEIDIAVMHSRAQGPGYSGQLARRLLHKASVLDAVGRDQEATVSRRAARDALIAAGLSDHPLMNRIRAR